MSNQITIKVITRNDNPKSRRHIGKMFKTHWEHPNPIDLSSKATKYVTLPGKNGILMIFRQKYK